MEQLVQKYPGDVEAALFYALALNETALPSDKSHANGLKAGAILYKVAHTLPYHPGVLHYTIHSFAYAPLARPASSPPTPSPKWLLLYRWPGTCRRAFIPCWGCGRNQLIRIRLH